MNEIGYKTNENISMKIFKHQFGWNVATTHTDNWFIFNVSITDANIKHKPVIGSTCQVQSFGGPCSTWLWQRRLINAELNAFLFLFRDVLCFKKFQAILFKNLHCFEKIYSVIYDVWTYRIKISNSRSQRLKKGRRNAIKTFRKTCCWHINQKL